MRLLKRRKAQDAMAMLLLGAALTVHCAVQWRTAKVKAPWIMSPYLFPTVLGGAAVLLGLSLLKTAAAEQREEGPAAPIRLREVLAVLALSILYDILMTRIGFLPATALYLLAMIAFLGERRPLVLVPVAALTPLALYVIFKLGLGVRLP